MLFVINVTAEFTSAVFLSVILLSILLQKEMRDIKTKLFFAAAVATVAGSVIDALSFILEAYPVPTALLWTVNVLSLVFCDINTVPFIYYAWHIISENDDLAAVGAEYGSGSDVLSLLAAAEQKMYTDKNRYYDTRKLPRRRINV